jgi:OmpA-OmpF porin, OOP family
MDGKGNRVTFPLGDVSFGDEVVSFKIGDPHAAPRYSDSKEALGPPNYDQIKDTNYVTLGCGGVLT